MDVLTPASLELMDKEGRTPLLRAALRGDVARVLELLNKGADPFYAVGIARGSKRIDVNGSLHDVVVDMRRTAEMFLLSDHDEKYGGVYPSQRFFEETLCPTFPGLTDLVTSRVDIGLSLIKIAADAYARGVPELLQATLTWMADRNYLAQAGYLLDAPVQSGELPLAIAVDRGDASLQLQMLEAGVDLSLESPSRLCAGGKEMLAKIAFKGAESISDLAIQLRLVELMTGWAEKKLEQDATRARAVLRALSTLAVEVQSPSLTGILYYCAIKLFDRASLGQYPTSFMDFIRSFAFMKKLIQQGRRWRRGGLLAVLTVL